MVAIHDKYSLQFPSLSGHESRLNSGNYRARNDSDSISINSKETSSSLKDEIDLNTSTETTSSEVIKKKTAS